MATLKKHIFLFLFSIVPLTLLADPTPPPVVVVPSSGGTADAPIDGGVVGLLIAGTAYGFYKFKKK